MLFQDATSGKILYRKFVKNETNKDYLSGLEYIQAGGTKIKAVVCDGHTGLLQAIISYPVQMCQKKSHTQHFFKKFLAFSFPSGKPGGPTLSS